MLEYKPSRNNISLEKMLGEVMEIMRKEKKDIKIITHYFSFIATYGDSYIEIYEKYRQALAFKNSTKRRWINNVLFCLR